MEILDLCKGKGCPIKKRCARYVPDGKGFFFHPQYRAGECILFVAKKKQKKRSGIKNRSFHLSIKIKSHRTDQNYLDSPCNL